MVSPKNLGPLLEGFGEPRVAEIPQEGEALGPVPWGGCGEDVSLTVVSPQGGSAGTWPGISSGPLAK